jgi:hypothetical protein
MAEEEWQKLYSPYNNRFRSGIQTIQNRQRAAALNLPGAEADIANAKNQIVITINEMRHKENELENLLNVMIADQSANKDIVTSEKAEIDTLKKKIHDARTLNGIRKEQVDALKSKNIGNYHTSYLGLWVPLREQTRVLLFAISVCLILVGIASVVFIVWIGKFPDKLVSPTIGGFLTFSRRK